MGRVDPQASFAQPSYIYHVVFFFFSSRRRHTRYIGDWSSDVCSSDLANFQQPMPIAGVAGESRHFQPDHKPGPTHAYLTDEPLETFPLRRQGGGASQIAVDEHNVIGVPAECDGALPESILAFRAFCVFQDLPRRGLTDI